MPSRRPHQKSHHGCDRCRTLKVKCDEEQPACSRCRKRGSPCIYRHLLSSYDPFKAKSRASSSSRASGELSITPSSQASTIGSPPLNDLDVDEDHRLFGHYMTAIVGSVPTLSFLENYDKWDNAVRNHAHSHPFLLQSVLALSCLHLAIHESPTKRSSSISRAYSYQNAAIVRFRPVLNNITPENCEAALTCAAIFIACNFAFAVARASIPSRAVEVVENSRQLISLLHGVVALYRLGWQNKMDKNISPFIRKNVLAHQSSSVPVPDGEASLDQLMDHIITPMRDSTRKETYIFCVNRLKWDLRRSAALPNAHSIMAGFIASIPKDFMPALEAHDPAALVLLAHWSVGLHGLSHFWWSRDWGKSTVKAIAEILGEEWEPLLKWPLEKVGAIVPPLPIIEFGGSPIPSS